MMKRVLSGCESLVCTAICSDISSTVMQISETVAPMAGQEPCRFPKLEECAHFHYEKVQLGTISVSLQTSMEQSLHSQHSSADETKDWYTLQVTSLEECWLIQRSYENFTMLDEQLHQCIYDRKVSQLPELTMEMGQQENLEALLSSYLNRFCSIIDNSLNCGPILNWFQLDNRGHRLLVPSEESRSINTPAVAAAYSIRKYVSQARDELSLEVGDMISVIDMASPGESMWWRGKRGFQVGFFPQQCVHIIGDKVPRNMPLPPPVVGSLAISPIKPVLRKHGKLITFFRSFILNRPSRRRLKQSGILKERVFGCDLGEHLLNSGHEIPMVLKCCAEFIEQNGIVDGIYRLSGVTSNIQKLRNSFDEDRIPNLHTDDILQDIHSVASLLKMYFRELPNPLCTYQLYQSFVQAVKKEQGERLVKMREAVQKLPPPHYRTLEYLMRHLAKVAKHGPQTGMTTRNIAIVWAPNLLRSEELEIGGVAALQGVGVQAVVTEFLICYSDYIFSDHLPTENVEIQSVSPKRCRPKSLAISTPTKLLTLEEARSRLNKDEGSFIEVGGGPKNLPKKYHTVIELPAGSRKRSLTKRSPSGWRSFFSKNRNSSHGNLSKHIEISPPGAIIAEKSITESDLTEIKRKLRPVKSAESLTSGQSEPTPCENDSLGPLYSLNKTQGHNRSVSHDSYFDNLQTSNNNSVGSLLDLSEIQLNFELEESEMRIFSEDESLVSSPKVNREMTSRKVLTRARPEDFSSAANSSNPSPKKQARVIISPDSLSRKRSRIEDQLSDIQYIDCNTPDNPCLISTTADIHSQDESIKGNTDQYQPKNKSPRNSHAINRHSLNFEKKDKINIPKSLTEMDIEKIGYNLTPSPTTPNYKPLDNNSSDVTPILSPIVSPESEIHYQNLLSDSCTLYPDERPKSCFIPDNKYENIADKKVLPYYENVKKTTINITYRSPVKTKSNSENIYEDVDPNPERAVVPTAIAELPVQEATQPDCKPKERPKNLDLLQNQTDELLKSCDEDSNGFKSATYKSIGSLSSTPISPSEAENSKKSLISPTEISLTEDQTSSSKQLSETSSEAPTPKSSTSSPVRESKSPKMTGFNDKLFDCNLTKVPEKVQFSSSNEASFIGSPKVGQILDLEPKLGAESPVEHFAKTGFLTDNVTKNNEVHFGSLDCKNIDLITGSPIGESSFGADMKSPMEVQVLDIKTQSFVSLSSKSPKEVHRGLPKCSSPIEVKKQEFGLLELKIRNENPKLEKMEVQQSSVGSKSPCASPRSFSLTPEKNVPRSPIQLSPKALSPEVLKKFCPENINQEQQTFSTSQTYAKRSSERINLESKSPVPQDQSFSLPNHKKGSCEKINLEPKSPVHDNHSPNSLSFVKRSVENINMECKSPVLYNQNFGSVNCVKSSLEKLNMDSRSPVFGSQNFETQNLTKRTSGEITSDLKSPVFNTKNIETDLLTDSNNLTNVMEPRLVDIGANVKPNETNSSPYVENNQIIDDNSIYQQVKYFRKSVHEINSLIEPETSQEPQNDNFDSLEAENIHIYENVDRKKDLDYSRNRIHQLEPKKIEIPKEELNVIPVCSKCLPTENETLKNTTVKNLTYKFEKTKDPQETKDKKQKNYEKDGIPPCLRAKNAKNSVKTKSLDENSFIAEFNKTPLQRRKSLDDRTSSYINSKLLIEPQKSPSKSTLDVSKIEEPKIECPITEQKLNRERIEKYKEERRNFLREKYRSESFREDKDKILSRIKQKSFRKTEETESLKITDKSPVTKRSPISDRKKNKEKILNENSDVGSEDEFLRHRRGDNESEKKRHTFDLVREREYDSETHRRVSLESRNPRKEKVSPSYCIKDMKAIFESKNSQQ